MVVGTNRLATQPSAPARSRVAPVAMTTRHGRLTERGSIEAIRQALLLEREPDLVAVRAPGVGVAVEDDAHVAGSRRFRRGDGRHERLDLGPGHVVAALAEAAGRVALVAPHRESCNVAAT